MFDPSRLLDQMMRGGVRHVGKKGKKGKKGWKSGKSGLDRLAHGAGVPGGALGLLGGLAIAAFEHYRQQQTPQAGSHRSPAPPPPGSPPPPPPGAPGRATAPPPPPPPPPVMNAPPSAPAVAAPGPDADRATLLIEAMIEAAKADGVIDPDERRQILDRLEDSGADDEARAFVEARMATPPALDRLIERINPGDPARRQLATEVYAASALAIEIDTEAERAYLRRLGESLQLDQLLRRHIHDSLGLEPL